MRIALRGANRCSRHLLMQQAVRAALARGSFAQAGVSLRDIPGYREFSIFVSERDGRDGEERFDTTEKRVFPVLHTLKNPGLSLAGPSARCYVRPCQKLPRHQRRHAQPYGQRLRPTRDQRQSVRPCASPCRKGALTFNKNSKEDFNARHELYVSRPTRKSAAARAAG